MSEVLLLIGSAQLSPVSVEAILAQKLGYPIIKADNGEHGLRLARADGHASPSLVIMDMNSLSGQGIIHVIREIRAAKPFLPILVFTSYGEDILAAQAIEAGATDFLTKPIAFERLRISIRNALHTQKISCELARLERRQPAQEAPIISDVKGCVRTLKAIEQEAIVLALQAADGCMTRAARNLGIGRSTLYRRLGDLEGYISRPNHTTRPMMRSSSLDRS